MPARCSGILRVRPNQVTSSALYLEARRDFFARTEASEQELQQLRGALEELVGPAEEVVACLRHTRSQWRSDGLVAMRGAYEAGALARTLSLATRLWHPSPGAPPPRVAKAVAREEVGGRALLNNGTLCLLDLGGGTLLIGSEATLRRVVTGIRRGSSGFTATPLFRRLAPRVDFGGADLALVRRPFGALEQHRGRGAVSPGFGPETGRLFGTLAASNLALQAGIRQGLVVTVLAEPPQAGQAQELVVGAQRLVDQGGLALRLAGLGALVQGADFELNGPLAQFRLRLSEADSLDLLDRLGLVLAGMQGSIL
ncbi:MAG: hypothetical protein MJD61_02130 [Proteobacteria bacterium]|nr:hypothetical protein [Pseudomonadota bacterium]